MLPTSERALSQPRPASPGSALGPLARPTRDLGVLVVVAVLLGGLVWARAGVEHPLPVSIGNATIENGDEVLADAGARLQELSAAQGGRIAEEAACYFWRPMGSTQGAMATEMFGSLMPGLEDAAAMDIVLCGPVELTPSGLMENLAASPWVPAMVGYVPGSSPDTYRGEVQTLLPMPLPATSGEVGADALLAADGRSPDGGVIDDPTWIEVEPSGEPGDSPFPPGVDIPGLPEIPDISIPDLGGGEGVG